MKKFDYAFKKIKVQDKRILKDYLLCSPFKMLTEKHYLT